MTPKKKAAPPWSALPKARPEAPPEEAGPPLSLPRFSSAWRLLIYPLCVLQPAAGLVLAALYLRQNDALARRFGRVCLVLAVLGLAVKGWRGMSVGSLQSGDSLLQPFY